MMLARNHIIVASETGFLYWINTTSFEVDYAKDLGTKGVYAAVFAPDYGTFVCADLSGSLFHATFAGDSPLLTEEAKQNENWVRLAPLRQLPLAVNLFSQAPVSYGLDVFPGSHRSHVWFGRIRHDLGLHFP